ncbi:MAG: RdgB/HAM1 family non-canonical purine NTP pyrophosphatase [Propionivibrio sp.]|uniref:RdgB/HAM1 family non-canonical purine NTP pyrophosphatase n=1 Tax=Propionivibrio sp. TaxID=2212460 RepID=UPI001A3EE419|nr:RdgB/HAM1 family non-canonical purine NTP pyrophosphatase [Propionivibrio sp.]MBL8415956.1 RdgB/HAM1 family non-canonical purine NTP pyrophosphatase [Propionivibrio sp.]
MKLVVASNNPGKLREFGALLAPLGWETIAQKELGVPECAEPHHTFVENALEKARHAARCTGLPALADDSGLCVNALGGAPGVYSAHYAQTAAGEAKSDERNNRKLIADLAGKTDRRAHYVCVLVFVRHADDPQPIIAEGEWHGEIVDQARGNAGFGYDPYFFLPELGLTSSELDPSEKNRRSHRGQALARLVKRLQARR